MRQRNQSIPSFQNQVTGGCMVRWTDCKRQVTKFRGAIHKSFKTMEEAEHFVLGNYVFLGFCKLDLI
uniref:Ribonuclease H1 N-terminal domain-containing protein n=1 Tax=Physcomitrium patens TaxID=3218 RepID=A0A2K1KGX6_PHYPA|nr:hypothetical protein PHYPA_009409 [Physcomitrium patens]